MASCSVARPRGSAHALGLLATLALLAPATAAQGAPSAPRVQFETRLGSFTLELMPEAAPKTVERFLGYVREDFYEGIVFHRVVPGFVVQTGGYTPALEARETGEPLPNEASLTGPENERGTVAMARHDDPDSATSQFFVNLDHNRRLDKRVGRPGYTVFARVTKGMQTIEHIAAVETRERGDMQNVPVEPVIITGSKILDVSPLSIDSAEASPR